MLNRSCILTGMLLATAMPSAAQIAMKADFKGPATDRKHYNAETICIMGFPVPVLNRKLTGADSIETIAHETMHVWQLAGHCAQLLNQWANDLPLKLAAEAVAFCYGMRKAARPIAVYNSRVVQAVLFWATWSPLEFEDINNIFNRTCYENR